MKRALTKSNYLEISYDEKKLPKTSYPKKLVDYLLRNHMHHAGSIVDIGCGRGEYLAEFEFKKFQVTGVDISPNIYQIKGNYKLHQCNFEQATLPIEDNSQDFIFSKSVLEYLHHPENLIDECYRLLKLGGKAIFMCPSWVHTYWGPFYIDHTHVTPFTLPSLCQLMELSGFKILHREHFIQLPILWKFHFLKIFSTLTAFLPIPFQPLYQTKWPLWFNNWVRFSKEKMLLVVGEK